MDGLVVRDVSDDDGLVGKFQAHPHEVMHVDVTLCGFMRMSWWISTDKP